MKTIRWQVGRLGGICGMGNSSIFCSENWDFYLLLNGMGNCFQNMMCNTEFSVLIPYTINFQRQFLRDFADLLLGKF